MKNSRTALLWLLSILTLGVFVQAQNEMPREINGGVLNGKAKSLPKPVYSAEAKAAKIEGTVVVTVIIDEQGTVISAEPAAAKSQKVRLGDGTVKIIEPEPVSPILFESAREAAMAATFSPTMLNDVPVKVRGVLTYRFVANPGLNEINGGVLNGKATSLPKPEYPAAARAVKAAGSVSVQVTVGENGEVESAEALSGHPLLRAAAVEAARGARFSPTLLSGNPVKITGVVVYNFVP